MKIISTGAADILLVDLPENLTFYSLACKADRECNEQILLAYSTMDKAFNPEYCQVLPEGYSYTILGRAKELTEEQCHLIARKQMDIYSFPMDVEYYNHNHGRYDDKLSAIGSFHSFFKSQGILLENPYPDPKQKHPMCRDCADEDGTCPNYGGRYCDPDLRLKQWHEAQSKVKNPLLIKAEKINPGE